MEIHQLELFLAVMETSSVTRAAEKVHLSPGAVSVQLHSLANELHAELFLRSGKRLIPTPTAYRLAEHARGVLRQVTNIRQEFDNDPTTDTRPFHFATGVTTLIYRLGRPLRLLRKQYPNTEIQVTVGVTEEIIAGLQQRRFDLGLISLPVAEDNLRILPLYEEELMVLRPSATRVRNGHVGTVRVADLEKVPFLLYPKQSNMRSIIDRFFKEIGLEPRVIMEADDTEAIKRLVECGFGYSILPEHALHGQPRFFQTLRIGRHRLMRQQALAMPKTEYPRKLTESVAGFLHAALSQPK
ncbi:MAG TPA: LysR family transcriptional regulator [Terriglobales bacterium]|nr:LysR family transcriptional regulator [Terriglobales bacterium]